MMLGEKISAESAETMGMIYKVFEDIDFESESMKVAVTLSKMPTRGLWLTKKALNQSFANNLGEQLSLEDELQREASKTYDYQEGVNAFLEKRTPLFKGE